MAWLSNSQCESPTEGDLLRVVLQLSVLGLGHEGERDGLVVSVGVGGIEHDLCDDGQSSLSHHEPLVDHSRWFVVDRAQEDDEGLRKKKKFKDVTICWIVCTFGVLRWSSKTK